MSGPTTRVLTVLELLQTHGQIGGAELAERLGVDRRTIRRYITVLEELGIPVMTEQGRYGGYRLVAGFKLPPMMFTDEETLAVSLGLLAARQLGLADAAPAIASVQAKLERVMPANLKKRVRGVSDTTRVILPRGEPSLDDRALQTLTVATEAMRSVGFTYHSPDHGGIDRSVDPYGLVFRQGRWYLTGFCHLRQAMRSFRLDRISHVHLLTATFQRPPDFDAADFLSESFLSWGRTHEVSLVLHTDRESASAVFGFHSSCAEGFEQREDGLLLTTQTDSFEWFSWWLAQLPFRFTILKPDGLKDALREHATRLLECCE
ncbi:Predicted DNA-binding transcriptional regulator YafY, contains an HTH and WYL domains [Marinobacter salarius]|jgi:predicted DNA-binding transcriptional regulator YafY|uniref:Transcriptional regulator n=3 Tax=Marinobacter TaxID=2742 RepID=W5YSB5_9GAMM|nr:MULTISPECIES: YafY family protein [Marinobacter]AHI31915.1 transcriptional regulator [Marinobacter salarius]KXJ43062.1 MAG: transcriptional regulator [Marinobacter sp. Hex_13]MBJ7276085.1 YafY family transcriptional regulator [Marinobacter salarius]MBS8232196.1 YafY family transcriptional regulator [Marinobacter salarius]SFL89089.1 Predicted DNA-binding transcriptional regulator YafY, contains an HTH and WYL domains [Marinobacter salarius]|tara:strand:+ start:1461 stop:2417 length:957 start_codon:yes stop_codon:yes gene_type:complete